MAAIDCRGRSGGMPGGERQSDRDPRTAVFTIAGSYASSVGAHNCIDKCQTQPVTV